MFGTLRLRLLLQRQRILRILKGNSIVQPSWLLLRLKTKPLQKELRLLHRVNLAYYGRRVPVLMRHKLAKRIDGLPLQSVLVLFHRGGVEVKSSITEDRIFWKAQGRVAICSS
jgi:hypothetical protein